MTAKVLGVVGGSGGVGASVLACAVAVRAASRERSVLLVDGCRWGGGLDVLMGAEQERGLRWADLASVRGGLDGAELRARLPVAEGVPVLAFDRSRDVALGVEPLQQVLHAARLASEVVVVDLPRPGDPLFGDLAAMVQSVVLVCGRGVSELAAATAVAPQVTAACESTWLCVRTAGRGVDFADEVAEALDLPLLAGLRDDPAIATDLLRGVPPGSRRRGPVGDVAEHVLARLADRRRVAS